MQTGGGDDQAVGCEDDVSVAVAVEPGGMAAEKAASLGPAILVETVKGTAAARVDRIGQFRQEGDDMLWYRTLLHAQQRMSGKGIAEVDV
ncbi:hypothetical protein TS85_23805 (plasmid) [Sphingomonas hengshuiensis]|uniref:Uncharacterized protein n=1 Tax=Sphingomonas hengshuiensis TaxID=1609977 RepID=A0A7U5BGG6_9SPHN|nr:hypothetical protein TS85_23805 [Sphingomonas hengshuiensis]